MKKNISLTLVFALFLLNMPLQAQNEDRNQLLNNLLKSIPSPLEMSSLIRKEGIQYDPSILNVPNRSTSYQTEFKQSLNLGIYSTDLGYTNIYEKKDTLGIAYLQSLRSLAQELNIDSLINFVTIAQYAITNNLNGLLAETSSSFDRINRSLIENKKPEASALILTGGWLETLYLTCQVAKKFPNPVLDNRIAEQKIILEQLLPLLQSYKQDEEMKELVGGLDELNELFKKIRIQQKIKADQNFRIVKLGNLEIVFYDNEKAKASKTKYKEEDLEQIINVSAKVRDKIVN
ncbi:MAG: hypothetical protein AAFU64_05880 [Bacteroidota bacterium]